MSTGARLLWGKDGEVGSAGAVRGAEGERAAGAAVPLGVPCRSAGLGFRMPARCEGNFQCGGGNCVVVVG